jgi:membrane associated rhomboid family serine protease
VLEILFDKHKFHVYLYFEDVFNVRLKHLCSVRHLRCGISGFYKMTELRMTSTIGLPASRQQAEQWSLVLRAANIPSVIEFEKRSWVIKVSALHEQKAVEEIAAFMEENTDWPPYRPQKKLPLPVLTKYQPPTLLMMGALVIFFIITGPWSGSSEWFTRGAVSGRQIFEHGQWYRLVTALTLHADVVHLVGNILIGGILVHFLCRLLGNGLGWFLILASGTLGNLMNIYLHGSSHNSVGFSTAIFGTIGILSGYQAVSKRSAALKEILLPLAAGAGLLAFLGAGGPRTDLGAHFFGLLAGAVLGILLVFLPSQRILINKTSLQINLFGASLAIVGLCWWFAMT